jgi:peptide/nickel transport system permease protein
MTVFIIRRLMQAAVVVFFMSLLVFSGVYLIGDPVEMLVADDADEYDREMVIKNLGLDQPFYIPILAVLISRAARQSWRELRF